MASLTKLMTPATLVTIAVLAASVLPLAAGLVQRELRAGSTMACAEARAHAGRGVQQS